MDLRVSNYMSSGSPAQGTAQTSNQGGGASALFGILDAMARGEQGSAGQAQTNGAQRQLAEILATNPGKGKLIDIRA